MAAGHGRGHERPWATRLCSCSQATTALGPFAAQNSPVRRILREVDVIRSRQRGLACGWHENRCGDWTTITIPHEVPDAFEIPHADCPGPARRADRRRAGRRAQEDTIKVGILHSLSGTMAISETTLKDAMLMLIDEQNKKGGLLGKKLEAVVVDPASDWPLFAEKARELIAEGQGRRRVRLLDLGSAQIRAAGLRGAEQPALLPRAVRGRGKLTQRLLHRRRAEPAGHPGRRLPDERGRRREALGAGRHRLRLSAHHQQDPRGLSACQGRGRTRTS